MGRRRRRTRVVLVGDIGGPDSFHVGDEAMFECDLALIRRLLPDPACIAVSADAAHSSARYGVDAVSRSQASRPAKRADLLVVTGGGNLNSTFPELLSQRLELARATDRAGGAVVLLGQMLGPQLTSADAQSLRELLGLAAFVGVRDADSLAVARRLGVADSRLFHQIDDAWTAGTETDPSSVLDLAAGSFTSVTMHPDPRIVPPTSIARLATQLAAIAKETSTPIVLLPHCSAPEGVGGTSDVDVAAALAEQLAAAGVPHRSLPVLAPSLVAAIARASALVLSTRYHPLVFALSGGVPALGVWADEYVHSKQRGALGAAGLEQWTMGLDEVFERGVVPAARELWDRRTEVREWLVVMARTLERQLDERDRALAECLRGAGINVRMPGAGPGAREALTEFGRAPEPSGRWHRLAAPAPGAQRRYTVVDRLRLEVRSDHVALTARVRTRDVEPTEVHFRVHEPALTDRVDASATPLLPCAVLLAARTGTDLVIDAPVDASALDAVGRVTKLYRDWWGWRPPEVDACGVERDREPTDGVGLWFSRGVDSLYTLLCSLDGTLVDEERALGVTHLLGLDWIDAPFASGCAPAIWADTAATATSLGLPVLRFTTDVRNLLDPVVGWSFTHATVFAGLGLLVGPLLGSVVISATAIGDSPPPYGSHPALDPLLGTRSTRIAHAGRRARSEKVARLAASGWALDALKVCWEVDTTRNCGRCVKCLATMTVLRAAGALDRCGRFDGRLTADAVRAVTRREQPMATVLDTVEDALAAAGTFDDELGEAWAEVLARMLREAEAPPQPRAPQPTDR